MCHAGDGGRIKGRVCHAVPLKVRCFQVRLLQWRLWRFLKQKQSKRIKSQHCKAAISLLHINIWSKLPFIVTHLFFLTILSLVCYFPNYKKILTCERCLINKPIFPLFFTRHTDKDWVLCNREMPQTTWHLQNTGKACLQRGTVVTQRHVHHPAAVSRWKSNTQTTAYSPIETFSFISF